MTPAERIAAAIGYRRPIDRMLGESIRCVEGCAIQSAGGDSRAGITFCGRHGWWPTWRPRSTT